MQLPDVNILVYAHREESPGHNRYADYLTELANGKQPFGLSEAVMSGFVRIVTNPRIFKPASTPEQAFRFLSELIQLPHVTLIRPGPNHWQIFEQLCLEHNLKGKMVADAFHAALAIESGCEWISADTDFARFASALRWRHL